jgi:hypothetical protein
LNPQSPMAPCASEERMGLVCGNHRVVESLLY